MPSNPNSNFNLKDLADELADSVSVEQAPVELDYPYWIPEEEPAQYAAWSDLSAEEEQRLRDQQQEYDNQYYQQQQVFYVPYYYDPMAFNQQVPVNHDLGGGYIGFGFGEAMEPFNDQPFIIFQQAADPSHSRQRG